MSKIKEIQSRLTQNSWEYARIRFLIAKQIFVFTVALYFLCYLFTVGGFYFGPFSIDTLAKITYHLYSLLIISTAIFGYSIVEYAASLHFPDKKIVLIIAGVIFAIFGIFALSVHLGFLSA